MNKTQLIQEVSITSELSKKDSTKVVNAVFDTVQNALKNGEKVDIIGFGSFNIKERSARKGRNPQTGEEIDIKASKSPTFKSGKNLKDAVKES